MVDDIHKAFAVAAAGSIQVAGFEVGVGVFEFGFPEVLEFVEDVRDDVDFCVIVLYILVLIHVFMRR